MELLQGDAVTTIGLVLVLLLVVVLVVEHVSMIPQQQQQQQGEEEPEHQGPRHETDPGPSKTQVSLVCREGTQQ